jgi:hypothetical protein
VGTVVGRLAAAKREVAVRLGERLVERVDQLAGPAAKDDVDVLSGASAQAQPQLDRDATLQQKARQAAVCLDAVQRAEQRHRRDPAPHAVGGDPRVAAVAADELLEMTLAW